MNTRLLRITLIFCFLFVLTISQLLSQIPGLSSLKVIKGKKNYYVDNIFQTKKGFIWFLTTEGVVKYDGQNYTHFTSANGLANNSVSAIAEDQDGALWLGHTNGQISVFTGNGAVVFKNDSMVISEKVTDIIILGQNSVWIATQGDGIYVLRGNKVSHLNTENGLNDDFIYDMETGKDNTLWIGTDAGISQLDSTGKTINHFTMSHGLPDNIVKQLHLKDNLLYVGMEEQGIGYIDLANKTYTAMGQWTFGNLIDFEVLNSNEIWVTTQQEGILRISKIKDYYTYKIIQHNGAINFQKPGFTFKDRENNIWIGAKESVILFADNNFNFIDHKEDIPFQQVYSFVVEDKYTYWAATNVGLFRINVLQNGNLTYARFFDKPEFDQISFVNLYLDSRSYIWASTYGFGVYRINTKDDTYEHYTSKKELSNDNVIYITGRNSNVYISTLGGGAMQADISSETPTFKPLNSEMGVRGKYVYQTVEDSTGRIWYGFDGDGLQMFDGKEWNSFATDTGMMKQTIYGFAVSGKNQVSFFTSGGQVYTLQGKTIENTSQKYNIPTIEISSITYTPDNNLLINSSSGIYILNWESTQVKVFSEDIGIIDFEPNLNAVSKDSSGNIWIGTANGVIQYKNKLNDEESVPILFIDNILVNYAPIQFSENTFSYTQKHWIFNYVGLWYKNPSAIWYRYMLEGYDKEWSIPTKNTSVTYSNLPSGTYTFKLQIAFEANHWIETTEGSYSFTIYPPIWLRWWFILAAILLTIFIVYLLFKWRISRLRLAKDMLEMEVVRRTAEIVKQKEEIEAQRDEIQSKNKNITDSIHYASRIQSAMLPPEDFITPILPSLFIYYQPRDIVSGDFYWLQHVNNKIYIVAADCTGHGVPGAFMSMLGISTLQQIVTNDYPDITASQILDQLRNAVKKSLRQTGKTGEAQDGMDMAICIYEHQTEKLQFAGANNPLVIIRNKEAIKYKGDKMPIGIYKHDDIHFTNHCIDLMPNDAIYMFTDGYEDQFGGPQGRKFLAKHFITLLENMNTQSPIEQTKKLDETITDWRGDFEQLDDILVIGFKHII